MADATGRIRSLDVVRGAVMVLMAIDHVRVYSGIPAGGPSPSVFFTRWVTHFCAPAFVFLAGAGAFLHGQKIRDRGSLGRYLLGRGLLLVLLELTVIRLAWTFNLDYSHYVLAGVIWMLGWCMVLMAGLVQLRTPAVGVLGLSVIFFQQIAALLPLALPKSVRAAAGWIWEFVYPAGSERWHGISILYTLVPWIGVMAAGYAFGTILARPDPDRRRLCFRIGSAATLLFIVIGSLVVALRPAPPDAPPALFRLLNQNKYPASQLFLLMTLGPTIALLPIAERARGAFSEILSVFGRVPMFYYLLHIPTIHVAAVLVSLFREGRVDPWLIANHPLEPPPVPDGYTWSLGLLYFVFTTVVVALYFPCRWFAGVKARQRAGWLRYL